MEPAAPADAAPSRLTTRQASALAFLIAATTLALQVLIHRIVSAKLLNNYAFLVISLTMLGFAISGVILTFISKTVARRLPETMVASACLLALTAIGSIALFASSTASPEELVNARSLIRSFLDWSPYALLLTTPFLFAGIMLGALLTDERLPTRRVYFFDLVGSALGALVVLPLFRYLSVETTIVGALIVLVAGVSALVRPRGRALRVLCLATGVVLVFSMVRRYEIFDIYFPEGSMLAMTRVPSSGTKLEYKEWDPLARIEVAAVRGRGPSTGVYASLFGENREFLRRYRKLLTQNNFAFTYAVDWDGRPETLVGIEETIYASAYYATPVKNPKVAVIGVGGGFDILTALRFDASDITGIEINSATLNIVQNVFRDYFRHWAEHAAVKLVNAEGRHYLSTSNERFDVVQLSGVDSYSGTPGAAHVFSENYLYTAEAFDLYLSRLSDQGVLNMMRLEARPAREMLRALTTAVAALRRAGVREPRNHIVMVTEHTGFFTAMLVKKTPFEAPELQNLRRWTSQRPSFGIWAEPGSSRTEVENAYHHFLALGDERLERRFIQQYPYAIDPVTDDRPFFFNFSFWWHLLPAPPQLAGQAPIYVPVLQLSLVVLAGAVSVVMVIAIFLPLAFLSRLHVPTPGRLSLAVYCAGAALGFLAVEVALMQLFGHFLGHPNYAISVVLAALLFSSGLGSLWAAQIVRRLTNIRFVSYLLASILLVEHFFFFPRLPQFVDLPFFTRVSMAAALVFPIGVCLGVFLPTVLDLIKQRSPQLVPWAWGVNGVFSVLAPLLAVALATTFGISALLLSAVPIYLLVSFSLPSLRSAEEGH